MFSALEDIHNVNNSIMRYEFLSLFLVGFLCSSHICFAVFLYLNTIHWANLDLILQSLAIEIPSPCSNILVVSRTKFSSQVCLIIGFDLRTSVFQLSFQSLNTDFEGVCKSNSSTRQQVEHTVGQKWWSERWN